MTVPIISIVGHAESGKTTLIEKLIPALKARGYRVGTIKHAREISMEPNKDSRRHLKAGSEAVLLAAPGEVLLLKSVAEPSIEEIGRLLDPSLDLVLCEGFKHTSLPKIELRRKGHGAPLEGITGVFAMVSDERLDGNVRVFKPEDIEGIADLLEKGFILPQRAWLDLYVNGKPAPVIGNICMDLTMIDVTPDHSDTEGEEHITLSRLSEVQEGDEVVIFGDLHPVAELAKEIGTIPYEVLTGISRRVKRIYYYE